MTESAYTPLVDGYTGLPVETRKERFAAGSAEWLLEAVERHALAERDALDQYEYIGTVSGDPVIALVMRLVLEDEERHHGLLKRIEASLRDALNWTHSPEALPPTATPQGPVSRELLETTYALVDEERTGARYLHELSRREKAVGSGLQSLLIEMMAMDSEKHARLLEFVRDRLAARARAEEGPTD